MAILTFKASVRWNCASVIGRKDRKIAIAVFIIIDGAGVFRREKGKQIYEVGYCLSFCSHH